MTKPQTGSDDALFSYWTFNPILDWTFNQWLLDTLPCSDCQEKIFIFGKIIEEI